MDIYRTLHSRRVEYTFFFKCPWNIYQVDYVLGYKTNLSKIKITKIIQTVSLTTMK